MTDHKIAHHRFVLNSSQNAGSLNRLRAQMADLERGRRIAGLRKKKAERLGQRVTQPDMAAAVGVSLRAAQEWEYGGGIDDDHLDALLKFLETDAEHLFRGDTPDLMRDLDPEPSAKSQLDRIERLVTAIAQKVGAEVEVKDYEAARSDAEASEPTPDTAPRKPRAKQKTPAAQPKPAQRS